MATFLPPFCAPVLLSITAILSAALTASEGGYASYAGGKATNGLNQQHSPRTTTMSVLPRRYSKALLSAGGKQQFSNWTKGKLNGRDSLVLGDKVGKAMDFRRGSTAPP